MLIIIKGKNLEVTPSMRSLAERKVAKLARYVPEIDLVEVEFSLEHTRSVVDREIVQVTLELGGSVLRAEARAAEVRVALDAVVDKLQNQLNDYHERQRTRTRGRTPQERVVVAEAGPTSGEYGAVTPPSPEEPAPHQRRRPGAG
ncbi:MAG: ribosome-associated translation inhibitor RaiA [Chloroflexi bacterium]|nr:ribosome-associated translation inhibitor RaiA [Chloroflexota bacterium]